MKHVPAFILIVASLTPPAKAQLAVPPPDAPQGAHTVPAPPPPPPHRNDLGKWWKNSQVVKELGLSDTQIMEIEQTFLDHRLKLIDLKAELERQEVRLQSLMEADKPSEATVGPQIDLVLAARGKLEKANTMMMLAIRRILSTEQWRKLQELQERRPEPSPPPAVPSSPANTPPPPSPPTPEDNLVYDIGGRIQPPRPLRQPAPQYTQQARDAGIEGLVLLRGIVRKDGRVDSVRVTRGAGYGLDEAAVQTVADAWRFAPGTLNGQPVDVRVNIEISFRLGK
jgi:TonB family protein